MKRVAIFTDFGSPDPKYSLDSVAEEQLGMLKRAGYDPIGIVDEGFQPARNWELAELRFLPPIDKSNHLNFQGDWMGKVNTILSQLPRVLEGVDVVISHDLIYQSSLVWHNIACRKYAKDHPEIKWMNWIHSATPSEVWSSNQEGLNTPFPNSKMVYPNEYSLPRIAINFKCALDQVAYIPHATDPFGFFGAGKIVQQFARDRLLLGADAIIVYPVRLDRGKQVEIAIDMVAGLKSVGKSARLVVVDFHSTGGDKVTYREELKRYAIDKRLNDVELSFTSEYIPVWNAGIPREDVRSLFQLSNIFILPSRSETYSLIAQEAALCGNLLILNFDFPPIRSVYGEKAVYGKFSSNIDALTGMDGETKTEYSNRDGYFRDLALRVAYELDNNFVLHQKTRVRKERNPDTVFQTYYEPVFHSWDG